MKKTALLIFFIWILFLYNSYAQKRYYSSELSLECVSKNTSILQFGIYTILKDSLYYNFCNTNGRVIFHAEIDTLGQVVNILNYKCSGIDSLNNCLLLDYLKNEKYYICNPYYDIYVSKEKFYITNNNIFKIGIAFPSVLTCKDKIPHLLETINNQSKNE